MTDRGTFVVNGAERVVVSQIHRSPGVIFSHEKGIYSSRIIPYRGRWLEFEIDQKKELFTRKLIARRASWVRSFLRALGYDTREKIIDVFYKIHLDEGVRRNGSSGRIWSDKVFARAVFTARKRGREKKLYRAGEKIHPHDVDELDSLGSGGRFRSSTSSIKQLPSFGDYSQLLRAGGDQVHEGRGPAGRTYERRRACLRSMRSSCPANLSPWKAQRKISTRCSSLPADMIWDASAGTS